MSKYFSGTKTYKGNKFRQPYTPSMRLFLTEARSILKMPLSTRSQRLSRRKITHGASLSW